MRKRSKYSIKTKIKATLAKIRGDNVYDISKGLGVPASLIYEWHRKYRGFVLDAISRDSFVKEKEAELKIYDVKKKEAEMQIRHAVLRRALDIYVWKDNIEKV